MREIGRSSSWAVVLGVTLGVVLAGCATEIAAPAADAGRDASVNTGTAVRLDGSASSDPGSRLLRFEWRFVEVPEGSTARINDASLARPSFTPDVAGDFILGLRVDNGVKRSAEDTITVTVGSGAPTAVIDPAPGVNTGTTVQLSGASSSDPDAHLLSFRWAFSSVPAGSQAQLIGADTAAPSFTPDVSGTYVARLVVNDGPFGNESAPASVSVSVGDGRPTAAIAPAGPISVAAGTTVQLSGSTSSDPDGHLLHYRWSFAAVPLGSKSQINEPAAVNPSFMPDRPGDYVVRLVVDDGAHGNASEPVENVVTVAGDCTPVANAGSDRTADQLASVQLDGSGSDSPCGRTLAYAWAFTSMPAASAAVINDGSLAAPAFVADLGGTYTLSLVVTDTEGLSSAADTVLVTVGSCVPTANPATPLAGELQGDTVQLAGGTPAELCGMPVVKWRWSFSSRPEGSLASLSSQADRNPTFVADLPGSYVLKLEVTNSGGLTSPMATVDVPGVGSCVPVPGIAADSARTVDGETVRLADVSTSPCGRSLAPAWKIVSAPSGSLAALTDAGSKTPAFDADLPGDYVVRLVVTDAAGVAGPPATVTVSAARRRVDVADTGSYGSLRLRGASEAPALSYYDATDGDLKYARFDGASWLVELVDLAGDVGRYTSLALTPDTAALPRIAYWDAGNDNLRYAERDSAGSWGTVTVDAADLEDGRYASLALDPTTGKPRIVYQARIVGVVLPRRVLKYAYCDAADCLVAANWTKLIIVDTAEGVNLGAAAQLALASGAPRFAYHHQTDGTLYFGACTDSTCATVSTRLVDGPSVGQETSLVLNAAGNPRIAYRDGGNGNAKFATCGDNATSVDCTAGTAVWAVATLETTGATGRQPSIALAPDATEDPRIVWQDFTRKVGRYATYSSATGLWTITDLIGSVGDSDRGLSLRLTAAGNPRISYYGGGVERASFYRREP